MGCEPGRPQRGSRRHPDEEQAEQALAVAQGAAHGRRREVGVQRADPRQGAGQGKRHADGGRTGCPTPPRRRQATGTHQRQNEEGGAENSSAGTTRADLAGAAPEPSAGDEAEDAPRHRRVRGEVPRVRK